MDVVEGRQRKEALAREWMQLGMFFEVLRGGCGRGTPEEGGIAPGVDAVGDVFEVLRGGCGRGTPEEGGIGPGGDAVGDVFEVLRGGCG